jgi:hypothetical protein
MPGNKKGAGKSKASTPKSTVDPVNAEIVDCGHCKKIVDEDDASIECHNCRVWFHRSCSDLNESEFRILSKGKQSILWSCMPCLQNKGTETKKFVQLEDKIEKMMTMMERIEERIMKKIEDKIDKRVEDKIQEFEKKLESKLEQKMEEEVEKEKRKNNIILSNIPESTDSNPDKRKEEDMQAVRKIINSINPTSKDDLSEVFRMGRHQMGSGSKPRKIKVTL